MKAYHIYDKNNDNMYVGFVIAENEEKAIEKVIEKHPHFSDDELQVVWKGNQGIYKAKSFGLEEMKESVESVRNYSNVIE
jgi:hypothetical protein